MDRKPFDTITARCLARARAAWREKAPTVALRWGVFLGAETDARAFAFGSDLAARTQRRTPPRRSPVSCHRPLRVWCDRVMPVGRVGPRLRRVDLLALLVFATISAVIATRAAETRPGYRWINPVWPGDGFLRGAQRCALPGLRPPLSKSGNVVPCFVSWVVVALAGAFLVVATSAFPLQAMASLALGISIGTLVVAASIAYGYRHHVPTVITAGLVAEVSAWTVIASLVFSLRTVQNLAFGSALAIVSLAVLGLTAHEISCCGRVAQTAVDGAGDSAWRLGAAA